MLFTVILFCSLAFAETKTLATQICLDRAGYSCNTIDGVWGGKSVQAFGGYLRGRGRDVKTELPPEQIYDNFLADHGDLFRIEVVTQADLDSLVTIPGTPAGKSKLDKLGYETIKEMFAERGHLSQRALERMNPGVDWDHVQPGLKLVIPDFPSIEQCLANGLPHRQQRSTRPLADLIRVSLSKFEITAWDARGRCIALYPCSIARDKSKRPPSGELKVITKIPHPNYTYSPDFVPKGQRASKYILMDGPNNPVGVAWIGLNLPTYGIHGTPHPETVGSAESHGCFRLSNWNVARLYALCRPGTRVVIDP